MGLCAALPLLAGVALAQEKRPGMPEQPGKMPLLTQDRDFIDKAAAIGMYEVKAAKLAMERGQSSQVKNTAKMLLDDHQKSNEELKTLAQKKGVTLPMTLPADMQANLDKLQKASGAEFDRMYMQQQQDGHKQAVSLFKTATSSSDPDLRQFAQKTLPTLQQHESMVNKSPNP
jgi:putative membrane protein